MRFVVLIGCVSLLADMTYEGARGITGPYLAILGAGAAVVGFVAGFGELVGYLVRLVSGPLSDRTGRYWAVMWTGYALNVLAVPALALTGRWETAAALMVLERLGRGIRVPARDALLARASESVGHGWAFGVHEALDQVGALLGPLVTAGVLQLSGYRAGFGILLVPALLTLAVLRLAQSRYPRPQDLGALRPAASGDGSLPASFWTYLLAVAFLAAGYADFPLLAYHFKKVGLVPDAGIPVLYALAMGVDAGAALVFGRLFDRIGVGALTIAALMASLFAPLAFLGGRPAAAAGVVLWGVGMGAQESIMRAVVARMVAPGRRGTAYGILNTGYGLAWFLGSALMGWLYDVSIPGLIGFSVLCQWAALPVLVVVGRSLRRP